jgi:hypothetical protein
MYKSSDTKEERERWVLGFGFAAAAAAGWGGAALS